MKERDREREAGRENELLLPPSLWPQGAFLVFDSSGIAEPRSSLSIQIKLLLQVLWSPKENRVIRPEIIYLPEYLQLCLPKYLLRECLLVCPLWLQIKVKVFPQYSVRPSSPSQSPGSQRSRLKRSRCCLPKSCFQKIRRINVRSEEWSLPQMLYSKTHPPLEGDPIT